MTYDKAVTKLLEIRREIARIEAEGKAQIAPLKKLAGDIENWITLQSQEEGLETVTTAHGTVYWSTHHSASVGEPGVFREFVITNQAWDLMETRASKTAVKSFIEAHGTVPPGVNYSSVRVFNLREKTKE